MARVNKKLFALQNERFASLVDEALVGQTHRAAKVFYVDSNTGSDNNSGTDIRSPLATLDKAHTNCTASQGDKVILLPQHAENISGAVTLSKAGVSYIGLQDGNSRATLTYTAAGGAITLSGANCLMANILLTTSGTIDVTTPIVVSGAKCVLKDLEMKEDSATSQLVYGVLVTGNDCVVDGLDFLGLAGSATVTGIRHTAADRLTIKNCTIVGNFQGSADATGAIQCLTTESVDMRVHHNVVENRDGTSEAGIVFTASCTGLVYQNMIAVPTGDFGQGLIADSGMRQFENYVVDVASERGAPEGTASA
jgi:hypothetical protein